jgi:hypothetical protein
MISFFLEVGTTPDSPITNKKEGFTRRGSKRLSKMSVDTRVDPQHDYMANGLCRPKKIA